jgi:acyl-CoA thioesterase
VSGPSTEQTNTKQTSTELGYELPWLWRALNSDASDELPLAQVSYEGHFSKAWYQGRGAYGGVVAAVAMRAMQRLCPHRPPRTFTMHFTAPALEGPGAASAQVVSEGGKVTHLSAQVRLGVQTTGEQAEQAEQGALVAFASATFAQERESKLHYAPASAPQAPHYSSIPEVPFELMPPTLAFTRFVSYRFALGQPPLSRAPKAIVGGWCDFKGEPPLDFSLLAALLDVWPPAIFSTMSRFTRAASVDLTYHFFVEELSALKRPFLYHGEVLSMVDGYAEERNVLWDAEGTLVASARQLIAVG